MGKTTPISETREFIEERFGEAINAREQATLPHLSRHGGLGPPDLCWVRKATVDKHGRDDEDVDPQGCYHFVLGLDVSSEACVAAYFGRLVAHLESPRLLSELVARFARGTSGRRRIQGGIYCCYDAFSGMDVRCELTVPGGSTSYAVDALGHRVADDDVGEAVWRGAWVSSVLRALRADPAAPIHVPCLRRFDPLPTPAAEAAFLAAARALYLEGHIIACAKTNAHRLFTHTNVATLDEDEGDVMGATISRHFISERRNAVAVGFFSQLLHSVPFAVVHIAGPLMAMGNAAGAVGRAFLLTEYSYWKQKRDSDPSFPLPSFARVTQHV